MYDKLFEPGRIGSVELRNRLVMEPMGVGLANLDGTPTEEMIRYYELRAAGGAGLVIPEICRIDDETGVGELRQISVTRDRNVPQLARLAEAIHRHGSKTFLQLHHPGRETPNVLLGGKPVVSASAIPCKKTQAETRALSTEEVQHIVQEFIEGAVRAERAGFDGVELHCAHGYLLQQFLSPYTNKRTDQYGGSFENRLRIVTEIIAGIRERCSAGFALGCRVSVEEFLDKTGVTEDYIHTADGVKICMAFEKAGVDFIDVSVGLYETGITCVEPVSYPEGWRHDIIRAVKEHVSVPVIAVSAYRGPDVPEAFLEEGTIDFAGLGRAWLADPEWGNKVQQGRVSELRKCISCLRCFESLEQNAEKCMPLECAVNPECAHELRYGELPIDVDHHHVVVIGGGPGGCQAAETAARRGCKVTLLEKGDRLGGQVLLAERPPRKEKMDFVPQYYETMLPKLGVDVRLGVEATVESVMALGPDAVICATGGDPLVPGSIPGIHGENVICVPEALSRESYEDKRVVVVGAGMTGLETAEYIADKGAASVTVVDMVATPAPGTNQTNLVDLMGRLRAQQVELKLGEKLVEVGSDGIAVESVADGGRSKVEADLVVLSLGNRPAKELAEGLRKRGVGVCLVGSAVRDGNIAPATRGGYEAARGLFSARAARSSFCMDSADLQKFGAPSVMSDQRGLYLAYTTDPSAIERILPAPLKPFSMPVVTLSVNHILRPSFTDDYYEAILGVYCYLGDQLGQYTMSLLLGGNGAEMATQLGRDNGSMPKKLGAQFSIRKEGSALFVDLARRGHRLVHVEADLGEYNSPLCHLIFQSPAAGKTTKGCGFYYHFDRPALPQGGAQLTGGAINAALVQYDYHKWEPGYVTSLKMESSPDDPWGELPVLSVLGCAYSELDLTVLGEKKLADVDAGEFFPYVFAGWYDRTTLGETGRV